MKEDKPDTVKVEGHTMARRPIKNLCLICWQCEANGEKYKYYSKQAKVCPRCQWAPAATNATNADAVAVTQPIEKPAPAKPSGSRKPSPKKTKGEEMAEPLWTFNHFSPQGLFKLVRRSPKGWYDEEGTFYEEYHYRGDAASELYKDKDAAVTAYKAAYREEATKRIQEAEAYLTNPDELDEAPEVPVVILVGDEANQQPAAPAVEPLPPAPDVDSPLALVRAVRQLARRLGGKAALIEFVKEL